MSSGHLPSRFEDVSKDQNRGSPNQKPSYSRKIWVINPQFQYRMIGFSALLSAVFAGVLYFAQNYFFSQFQDSGVALGLDSNHVYFQFLEQQKTVLTKVFFTITAFFLGISSFLALLFSHRIAGPIYRLCKTMNEVAIGKQNYRPIKFRDHDSFPELAESYNILMESLSVQKEEIKKERIV